MDVFFASSLLFHGLLIVTFISFFNNYFLPLVPFAALLTAGALPRLPAPMSVRRQLVFWGSPALLVFGWTLLHLDLLYRYVEADERLRNVLIAEGTEPHKIFGYPGGFVRHHYDIADREILKNPWGIFPRMRRRTELVILPERLSLPSDVSRSVIRRASYQTLAGERILEVHERRSRRQRR